jgi:hypothetical protein
VCLQTLNKFGSTLKFSFLSENVRSTIKINVLCIVCLFCIHLHLVPSLRMSGAELLHLFAFMVWLGKNLPYFVEKVKTSFLSDMALYVVSSQLKHVKCPKRQFCLKCTLLSTCILQCTVSLLSQFCCHIINIKTVN